MFGVTTNKPVGLAVLSFISSICMYLRDICVSLGLFYNCDFLVAFLHCFVRRHGYAVCGDVTKIDTKVTVSVFTLLSNNHD